MLLNQDIKRVDNFCFSVVILFLDFHFFSWTL